MWQATELLLGFRCVAPKEPLWGTLVLQQFYAASSRISITDQYKVIDDNLDCMGSYRQLFYHIIFGTKYRKPTIDEAHCKDLYRYMSGIIKKKNCKLYRINGVEDHIHIFSDLHPSISLSDYVKDIKSGKQHLDQGIWQVPTF